MSGRSPTAGRNNRHHYNDDNVESYRQKSRQNNRKQREDYDEEYSSRRDNNNNQDERKKQLAFERKQRMARLREEIKKEDETLAALDKKQQQQVQSNDDNGQTDKISPQETIIEVKPEELEGLDQEEQMRRLLGFNGFGSTKGEAVDDNQSTAARGGAAKNKARKYRQYMNRKSGFNRPLEKMK